MPQNQTFSDVQPVAQTFTDVAPIEQPKARNWLDSASDAASEFWKQINPVSAVQGMRDVVNHPIAAYMQDAGQRQEIMNKAEAAFKSGKYAEGIAHVVPALIPFIGPAAQNVGDLAEQGQYAKAAGAGLGLVANAAAPELIKDVTPKLPSKLAAKAAGSAKSWYRSALKPSTTLPASKVASAVETGLENRIPVSAGGMEKIGNLIDDLNAKIKAEISTRSAQPGSMVSTSKVADRLIDTKNKFATQVNPTADLNAIRESGADFLSTNPAYLSLEDAQALKQGTYAQLKGRAYGELKSATVEAQKALARGLKEEIANAFPEIDKLNAQESKLLGLDAIMEKAVKRIGNHQLTGIGTPIAAAGAKAVTGSTGAAAVIGALRGIIEDPWIKSKIAMALYRGSKGQITIPMGLARVQGYANLLAQPVEASASKGTTAPEPALAY